VRSPDVAEQPLDHGPVEVVAAQMRVTVGRQHLEHAVLDPKIEMSKVPPPRS
jgi:NAD-specific glutamate dehydrogenase.